MRGYRVNLTDWERQGEVAHFIREANMLSSIVSKGEVVLSSVVSKGEVVERKGWG